jgi:uncharacterized protein
MSNFELPERIHPYQLVEKQEELEGVVAASRLPRLMQAATAIDEPARVHLTFKRDDSGRRVISGKVSCAVELQCQRCLTSFSYELSGEFALALVYNDEMAKALPAELDPLLLLPDVQLEVASIVEDELLLSLPMHAMHPEGNCQIKTQFGMDDSEQATERAPSPFDILKDLK